MNSTSSQRMLSQLALVMFTLCVTASFALAATASLIEQKYNSLGGARSFLGLPTTPETAAPDKIGAYRHYQGGSIYWSPQTDAHEIHGAIRDKWASMGWERGYGYPTTDERITPDGRGRYNHFGGGGSIYWTPQTGAHAIWGTIREKWASLGWERGYGYPTTDEMGTPDKRGRYNHFEGGRSIYWTSETGAHTIYGAIRDKWASLGWERGYGYPTTDQLVTPDTRGRYNHFDGGGSIYWTPQTGAHAIWGKIREKWASLGWENGWLGYPATDELGTADGIWRFNHFEHGSISSSRETGEVEYASGKPGNAHGRNPYWGLLANPGFEGKPMKSAYFFAGDWRFQGFKDSQCNNQPGFSKFYEYCTEAIDKLFTIHPSNAQDLGWSESVNNRSYALDNMIAAGVNVVNMSFWGKRGDDRWAHWAPMQTSTYAHDELFDVAVEKNMLIAPYIEGGNSTKPFGGKSDAFSFADDFPGTQSNPSPALVEQIVDLVNRYLLHPEKPQWPTRWAQMYDQSGQKRYVISIIHASSKQPGVDANLYAKGLDWVADKVAASTGGVRIGFTLDMIPEAEGYFPTPASSGVTLPFIQQGLPGAQSLLAIECFIPEISAVGNYRDNQPRPSGHYYGAGNEFHQEGEPILIDTLDLANLIFWKENFVRSWVETGIPVILDVAPGYDGHIVFAQKEPGSPIPAIWGNNDQWRNAQTRMIALGVKGITFNTWNGYTEGYAAVPTLEFGNANYTWLKSVNALIP